MLCQSLYEEIGLDCQLIERGESAAIRVMTPVDFSDGAPFYFYMQELSNGYSIITDDCDSIFHFQALGLINCERKSWRGITTLAERHGFTLSESGELAVTFETKNRSLYLSKALEIGYALKVWEQDRLGKDLIDLFFVDEVEMALRSWKPDIEIIKKPSVAGYSKRTYDFDLGFDDLLIDAIKPNARSTGTKLRKILDVQKGASGAEMLFIVDDRDNADRARMERDLIGGIAKAMLFSHLQLKAPHQQA